MAAGLLALPFGTAHAAETPVYDTSQAALAQSQLRDVTGRVTDRATGDPIVGVTVANNSTGSGTVTDAAGAFTVQAATGQLLTISCVGYTSWTVKVPASGAIDVELSEDAQQLDDVVVVGYATQKKINVTGAVSSISGEELAQRPVVSTMQALQGIDPSLNISIDSGNPTAGNSLNIRGVPSINGGSPLILVDGVPGVSLRLVNAADIESISVLKDASASAIYGTKASAGVILVTTKKGAAGKATVSYSNNIGWTQPTTPTDFITNGYDYATIVNDLYFSRYAYNAFNYTDADWAALEARRYDTTERPDRPWVVIGDDGKYHYYGNFDWYHSIYNTNRFHQEHNLSLSGGGKDVNYYVSGRYYQQDGVLGGNMIRNKENYKNYSFRAKFDAQLFKWAKWSTNASLNAVNQKYPGPLNEAQTIAALEENVAPMFVPYNPDGSIVMYPADLRNVALGKGRTAALADPTNKHTIENLSLTLSNSLQLKLHKDLTFDASYNINNYRRLYKDRTAANIYSDAVGVTKTTTHYQKDTYRERPYEYTYHNVDAYFTYEHSWNKEHNFKAVAGMNYEKYRLVDNIVEQFGLGSDQIDSFNSVNDDTYWLVQQDISAYKTLGFFARINYDYKGKYLFEASMRADGTSRFAKKDRWGYFPSVSAGWRFTEEQFMEGVRHWWDNGKIRLSYGALGNSNVDPYTYLETFGLSTFGTGSGDAARYLFGQAKLRYTSLPGQIPDNIGWETSKTFDVGLDAGFLNGRLNLTADYYIRKTVDMYTVGPTLPDTFGATAPKGNYADMSTYGYEIALSYNDSFKLAGKPFNFGIKATLADYYSIIDRYNNASRKLSDYYEGQRLGEIWGFVCNGLFQSQAEIDAAFGGKGYKNDIMQTSEKYITYPGDMRFEDLNGNDAIDRGSSTVDDPGDRKIIGNSEPRYLYTISLNADWNGFFLSALFDGVGRQQWFPSDESLFWGMYNRPYNQVPTWHLQNYWTEERPNAYLPRYVGYYGPMNANTVNVNTRYLQDVSYIRLKNLQFGYELPKRWISKIGLSKVSVYFSGENLWSWSPLYRHTKDFDVTVASKKSDSDISDSKGDGHNYPVMRSFSFGISITY